MLLTIIISSKETCEFQIDEIFHVASGAPVVGGLLARGALNEGDTLLVGEEFMPGLF